MNLFSKRARVKWNPPPNSYPSEAMVRENPELDGLEHNAHFRMCEATMSNPSAWIPYALGMCLIGCIIFLPVFSRDTPLDEAFAALGVINALVLLAALVANAATPFQLSSALNYIHPNDNDHCADYLASGITAREIVAALLGIRLSRDKEVARKGLMWIALVPPVVVMVLNPTEQMWYSQGFILAVGCCLIGGNRRPSGIAACGVLTHTKSNASTLEARRNPFGYWKKNVGPVVLKLIGIGLLLLFAVTMLIMVASALLVSFKKWNASPPLWVWIAGYLILCAGCYGLGEWRARYLMERKDGYLAKAEDYVRAIYEMKRQDIFENASPGNRK